MKPFSQWTIEEVEETFQLTQELESQRLQAWLQPQIVPTVQERAELDALHSKLVEHVYDWNEQELIVYFIGPLLTLVNFEGDTYQPFFGREISVNYDHERLSGVVDFMVAQGRRSPKHPYFFIHEYKKEYDSSNDPLGQLLIAMVAAQLLNQDSHPFYGAYVIGRYWHFVMLEGSSYAVNPGYNAAREELFEIFGVLCKTRTLITKMAQGTVGQ